MKESCRLFGYQFLILCPSVNGISFVSSNNMLIKKECLWMKDQHLESIICPPIISFLLYFLFTFGNEIDCCSLHLQFLFLISFLFLLAVVSWHYIIIFFLCVSYFLLQFLDGQWINLQNSWMNLLFFLSSLIFLLYNLEITNLFPQ